MEPDAKKLSAEGLSPDWSAEDSAKAEALAEEERWRNAAGCNVNRLRLKNKIKNKSKA